MKTAAMNILVIAEGARFLCSAGGTTCTALPSHDPSANDPVAMPQGCHGVVFFGVNDDPLASIARSGIHGRVPIGLFAGDEIMRTSDGITPFECNWFASHIRKVPYVPIETGPGRTFIIDQRAREVRVGAKRMMCSPLEFRLLVLFLRHPDVLFSRSELLRRISGLGERGHPNVVNVMVRRLREKLELDPQAPTHIHAARGIGYIFRHTADVFLDALTKNRFVVWPSR